MARTVLAWVEGVLLAWLLEKVIAAGGFIPEPAYRLFHKLVPWPAVEVLICDDAGRFLLLYRDDEDFVGWHLPGGYMRPNETILKACNRHVRKDDVASKLSEPRIIAAHPWLEEEHPFGFPLSLVVVCGATGVVERNDLKWFSEVPLNMVEPNHMRFAAYFQSWQSHRERYAAIL